MLTEGKQGRRGLNTFIHALVSLPPSVFCSVQRWLFVNEMTPSGRLTEAEHGLCFFRDSKVDPWGENSTSYGTVSSSSTVKRWAALLQQGRVACKDDPQSSPSTAVTKEAVTMLEDTIIENQRISVQYIASQGRISNRFVGRSPQSFQVDCPMGLSCADA